MIKLSKSYSTVYKIKAFIAFLIFIPFHFLIYTPVVLFRNAVSILSSLFRPDLGRMLSPCSSLLALESDVLPMYTVRSTSTVMPILMLEGIVDFNILKERLERLIYQERFAELRQFLSKWCGFYFWKWDNNFSLNEHLIHVEEEITQEEFKKFVKELQQKPYVKNKPLWSLIVFSNLREDLPKNGKHERSSAVLFRTHHALCDGYSTILLIDELRRSTTEETDSIFDSVSKPEYPKMTLSERVRQSLETVFFGPISVIESVFQQQFSPCRWNMDTKKLSYEYFEDGTDDVSFDDVKDAAKSLKIPTSALLFAAYAGVIRKTMLKMGETIPQKFHMTIPLPLPGHPDYLTNYMLLVPVLSPLEIEDPLQRLQETKRRFKELKYSPLPMGFYYLSTFLGNIAGFGLLNNVQIAPGIFNNFSGPRKQLMFINTLMRTLWVAGGIPLGSYSGLFCSHSYGGKLILRLAFDKSLYTDQEVPEFMLRTLLEEIENYKDIATRRGYRIE